MPVSHQIRPDGILEVERWGTINVPDDDADLEERLKDPGIVPGMRVLVDSRRMEPSDFCEVIQHLAALARATAARLECGALALVVKSDVQYGMARMYMALTEVGHPNTRVFRDYEEAVAWLSSEAVDALRQGPAGSPPTK